MTASDSQPIVPAYLRRPRFECPPTRNPLAAGVFYGRGWLHGDAMVWSFGAEASLYVTSDVPKGTTLKLSLQCLHRADLKDRFIELLVDQTVVAREAVPHSGAVTLSLTQNADGRQVTPVTLRLSDSHTPEQLTGSPDYRRLGFFIASALFEGVSHPAPDTADQPTPAATDRPPLVRSIKRRLGRAVG